jgi:hypothetical protein
VHTDKTSSTAFLRVSRRFQRSKKQFFVPNFRIDAKGELISDELERITSTLASYRIRFPNV